MNCGVLYAMAQDQAQQTPSDADQLQPRISRAAHPKDNGSLTENKNDQQHPHV